MMTWRTPDSEETYRIARQGFSGECRICRIPVKREEGSFYIVANEFPYDAVSAVNDMLILKNHAPRLNITQIEELEEFKRKLGEERFYDLLLENLPCRKTIPDHFHLHLIRIRPAEGGVF